MCNSLSFGNLTYNLQNRKQIAYNATWTTDGVTMRGTSSPGCGYIKPNTLAIRRLHLDEGIRRVEERGEINRRHTGQHEYSKSNIRMQKCQVSL